MMWNNVVFLNEGENFESWKVDVITRVHFPIESEKYNENERHRARYIF